MTAAEKARELFDKYLSYQINNQYQRQTAKGCATVAVDEIIEECKMLSTAAFYNRLSYWQQVRTEIEQIES